MTEQIESQKQQGNSAVEYVLAGLGGVLGGIVGIGASPLALYFLSKKFNGAAKWGLWAAIGVIGAPVSAAITVAMLPGECEEQVATKPAAVEQSVESTAPAPNSAYGLQEKIVSGDRAITVMEASTQEGITPQNQFADPITGTVVLVGLAIENTGNESGNMMFSSFTLTDSQGRSYDELSATDTSFSIWKDEVGFKSRSEDLYPGEARMDVVAFRVAPDASGFTMEWKGNQVDLGI